MVVPSAEREVDARDEGPPLVHHDHLLVVRPEHDAPGAVVGVAEHLQGRGRGIRWSLGSLYLDLFFTGF